MERYRVVCAAAIFAFAACASPSPPPENPPTAPVGAVQREIKAGMDQSAVTEALGPPSKVSNDSQGRETWTYDAISSNRLDTTRSIGGALVVLSADPSSGDENQRTLTLVIYYDDAKKVREFAYNYSSY